MRPDASWSVVAVSEELGDVKPIPVHAEGQELALFRDATGVARAVENRCPHRRVPLTLGKVVGGAIRCAYHGWTFDGASGSCIDVPNLGADEKVSPNFCVRTFPCREHGGFVYVWTSAEEPAGHLVFEQDNISSEPALHTSGSGIAPVGIGHYRDALIDGPQALLTISGVRITDFFLGDAVVESGRVIIDREAEWGDPDLPAAIKITDRPMVLRTELLAQGNGAVFSLFDDQGSLLAEILLAFSEAPRGGTSFCWRFRRYPAFRALQPWKIRMRYGRRKPAEIYSRVDGSALANLLVGPSFDYHNLTTIAEAS